LHLTLDVPETAHGLWEPAPRRIVIHRSCLASVDRFVATLRHEIGLTDLLGTGGTRAVTTR
jgi:hypothetical protein